MAPTGAETSKHDCPQLPTTLEELVETAQTCAAAGAAMIHVHVRDAEHRPTLDPSLLAETVAALRESTDLVVQLSTGGSVHDPLEARLKVLDAQPDSCSLTMGTVNFGDDVFSNPWPFICDLYQQSQERRVVPEFELFDLGHVDALGRLLSYLRPPPSAVSVHCDFVLGVPGGHARHGRRPRGRRQPLCRPRSPRGRPPASDAAPFRSRMTALSKGGHLRVGMEDVLTLRRGSCGSAQHGTRADAPSTWPSGSAPTYDP